MVGVKFNMYIVFSKVIDTYYVMSVVRFTKSTGISYEL